VLRKREGVGMSGTGFAARLSCAVYVGCVLGFGASAAVAIEPKAGGAAKAGDCLSGPKGAAPQGERWYYRVDRSTQRHCWYTRAGTTRVVAAQKPPLAEPVVASSAPEPVPEPLLPAVADARAEAGVSPIPSPPAPVSAPPEVQPARESNRLSGTLADRWPGHEPAYQVTQSPPKIAMPPTARIQETEPAEAEADGLWIVIGAAGIAAALVGLAMPLLVAFLRRRRQIRTLSWDADGSRTWHEPPRQHPQAARPTF
jgi:hypothetical protein